MLLDQQGPNAAYTSDPGDWLGVTTPDEHDEAPSLLTGALVIIGLLAAIVAAGALAAFHPYLGLTLVAGAIVVLLLLRRLEFAAILMIAAAPFDSYLKVYINPGAFKAIGGIFLVSFVINRFRGQPTRRQPLSVAISVFLCLMLLATLVHPNGSEGMQTVQRYLSFGLAALALVSTLGRELRPSIAVAAYTYAATAASVFALYDFFSRVSLRGSGPIEDPNDLAYVLMAAIPFALWLAGRCNPVFHWLCTAVLVGGAASTLSRGAAIAGVVMLAIALWRGHLAWSMIVGSLMALAIAIPLVTTLYPRVLDTALQQKQYVAGHNIDTRELRWHAALEMTWSNPVTGVGPAGFRQNYLVVSDHAEPAEPAAVSHDMYLEVSSELGIPALIAFLTVIGLAWRGADSARLLTRGPESKLASAAQISLLGTVMASIFLTEQYYLTLWFILALCAALAGRAQSAAESRPETVAP